MQAILLKAQSACSVNIFFLSFMSQNFCVSGIDKKNLITNGKSFSKGTEIKNAGTGIGIKNVFIAIVQTQKQLRIHTRMCEFCARCS